MPLTNPYQVTETDKDLLQIAIKQGVSFWQLRKLNPNITSISPGQYINIPTANTPKPYNPFQPAITAFQQAGSALKNEFNYFAGAVTKSPYGFTTNFADQAYKLNPNLPNPVGGVGNNPYGPPAPAAGTSPASTAWNPVMGGDRNIEGQNDTIRLYQLRTTMQNATDPSQLPGTITNADAARLGYSPAQMTQAGYVMKNGSWINAAAVSPSGAGAGFQSGNNWQTNPSLYRLQHGRNAKNKRNQFETNLKWERNFWRRKKRQAKGIGGPRTEPGADIRPDTPSTTLDLILGS
jgi:hypothetical protein